MREGEIYPFSEILISDKAQAADNAEIRKNPCSALDIPTQVNKIGDGLVYLVDDTENDRIMVFEKV